MAKTQPVVGPAVPTTGRFRPLGIDEVHIVGGFWGARQDVNARRTLSHVRHCLEREGWIANFDQVAEGSQIGERRGREFSDSEVYKYLEAVAWEIGREPTADLEQDLAHLVARVAAAQQPDGYLNTNFGRSGQAARWSDLEWGHELYCLGHLFQAAVARERTAPGADDGLLRIALRAADLVCEVFGPDGMDAVCGHPEVEMGLAELGRLTGAQRYVDQAALFIERRGRGTLRDPEWGYEYFQDDVPVRETVALHGHAVRANYLAAGAVDVAVERSDEELLNSLAGQWAHTNARRTYVTGGQGSRHQDEAFGEDWMLPPDRAYSETCAGIASVQFAWRLLLAQGGVHYADAIERTLFNVVATSPSQTGDRFFYANTLYQRRLGVAVDSDQVSPRASSSMRAPWFEVSCCPPNVARTFAQLAGYMATASDSGIQIQQYAPSTIRTRLADGTPIALDVETAYPFDGEVVVTFRDTSESPWTLSLRVPEWSGESELVVEGAGAKGATSRVAPGYATVDRAFQEGDRVTLRLNVEPRLTTADPHVDATRGCVAVEAGPLVYCAESVDLEAAGVATVDNDLAGLEIDLTHAPTQVGERVRVAVRMRPDAAERWPYRALSAAGGTGQPRTGEVDLVPYNAWANRGPSTMRVWIPVVDA